MTARHPLARAYSREVRPVLALMGQAGDTLLTRSEVARLFGVGPKTVTQWGKADLLGSIRTPGGHRRYRESEVRNLLTREP